MNGKLTGTFDEIDDDSETNILQTKAIAVYMLEGNLFSVW